MAGTLVPGKYMVSRFFLWRLFLSRVSKDLEKSWTFKSCLGISRRKKPVHVSCQIPHQLCDPKLVVSKLNSLNIVDIKTPVSDRTLVGDLTESSFYLVLLCDLSFKRRVQIALKSHCGPWICCCWQTVSWVVVLWGFFSQKYLSKKKPPKFNNFGLEALAEISSISFGFI